jgi:hypothetical protein
MLSFNYAYAWDLTRMRCNKNHVLAQNMALSFKIHTHMCLLTRIDQV